MINRHLICILIVCLGCTKEPKDSLNGKLTGQVKDNQGNPLSGVSILIDNSIFFNNYLSTKTNNEGQYSIGVPRGSWFAFAMLKKNYHGKDYHLYLHPENSAGFGAEGGIRNFVWKLTGNKPQPLSGYYGASLTLDNFPGYYIESTKIQVTFEPQGELIDGSITSTFQRMPTDGYQINDFPIGRYKVTARYLNQKIKLRKWNTDDPFTESILMNIEPTIDGQCDNCYKLEYNQ